MYELSAEDFSITMKGPKGQERMEILDEPPLPEIFLSLFYQLGAMHLVAPYLPKTIRTNFTFSAAIKHLVGAMYRSENKVRPSFVTSDLLPREEFEKFLGPFPERVAILYSGGLDSMWNLMWAEEKYGRENILLIHINGLNRSNAKFEYLATMEQIGKLGIKNVEVINLKTSSRNTNHKVMRSRDMFIAGLAVPYALRFGASKIIMEGFAEAGPDEPFTGQEKNMEMFNERVLDALGIPVRVFWRNRREMDIVRDLCERRPDWMPLICNCFMPPHWRKGHQGLWHKRTPHFPLYKNQCGVCPKCQRSKIGEIRWNPLVAATVPTEEIQTYLALTVRRINNKERLRFRDATTPSLLRDLQWSCKKFNVPYRQPA